MYNVLRITCIKKCNKDLQLPVKVYFILSSQISNNIFFFSFQEITAGLSFLFIIFISYHIVLFKHRILIQFKFFFIIPDHCLKEFEVNVYCTAVFLYFFMFLVLRKSLNIFYIYSIYRNLFVFM